MKKCPFCAEDIQDQATVCKHCKRSLTPTPQPQVSTSMPGSITALTTHRSVDWKKVLKIFGIVILIILSFQFWYITIPAAAIWYLWNKTKFSKKTNIITTAALIVVFAILGGAAAYAGRGPTLTITEPENNYSIQAQAVSIKGKVSPAKASILVNGNRVSTDGSGNFSYQAQLPSEGNNQVLVVASNGDKQTSDTLTINRIFTDKEKSAKAQAEADAEAKAKADADATAAAQAAADAKAKAEQEAYDNSKAGKICKAHPTWSKDDCDTIAEGKVHVGMTKDQAIAAWGKPQDINTTSSSYGTHEQWVYGLSSYLYFDGEFLTTIQN